MRPTMMMIAVVVAATAGCPTASLKKEPTTSGVGGAEEVGTTKVPPGLLHLQVAKEARDKAALLSRDGEKESFQTRDLSNATQRKWELASASIAQADFVDAHEKVVEKTKAEQRAAAAQAVLAMVATVKEQPRGLVITLLDSVLFASEEASLLRDAQVTLTQVGEVLMSTRERRVAVEGHTDARGSEAHNVDLSQRRADAVRDSLVKQGYQADLITSTGLGEARPIASNDDAEGRANNRRVEIIIARDSLTPNP